MLQCHGLFSRVILVFELVMITTAAHAMAYDPDSQKVVIFGGYDDAGTHLDETWTFDGRTWSKEIPSVSPPPRAAGSMAYDSVTQKVVMFGGFNGTSYLGDTWSWDGGVSSWTLENSPTAPPAVTSPIAFTDPPTGHAMIFGGYDGMFYQHGTFRWGPAGWEELHPTNSPGARPPPRPPSTRTPVLSCCSAAWRASTRSTRGCGTGPTGPASSPRRNRPGVMTRGRLRAGLEWCDRLRRRERW
jgi:hypothetical protein